MTIVFFGHRDAPDSVRPILRQTVLNLIETEGVTHFLVGNEGNFDRMVHGVLEEISRKNSFLQYDIVLAYLPRDESPLMQMERTLYPEGLECVPKRFAISKRNLWMLERSDFAVCYVSTTVGNSYRLMETAIRKGKSVLNLANLTEKGS